MKKLFLLFVLSAVLPAFPQSAPTDTPTAAIVARIVARERAFPAELAKYQPLAETYLQQLGADPDLGTVPNRDHYFLGYLDLRHGIDSDLFAGVYDRHKSFLGSVFYPYNQYFALQYTATGFVNMIAPDPDRFDADHYRFTYTGSQFLGDVHCLMFDVAPRVGRGQFVGRIWVEDRDDNIVRFDGTFTPQPRMVRYFHFDSWRGYMNGQWLPASIYVEEGQVNKMIAGHVNLKGQTRFWGYNRDLPTVADAGGTNHDLSPLEQQRHWQTKAEDDVLNRLTRAGLLAPPGEVDHTLETVVNNLEVANHLSIDPEIRCRVLLTTPLESFTVGHTIVVSRGLLDVLPDEASLAAILAHEVGHVVLNHRLNTMYAFDDEMMFADTLSFADLHLSRSKQEEKAADAEGMKLLANSPYRDRLGHAGLFLEALQREGHALPNLTSPLLGDRMFVHGHLQRMHALLEGAPRLEPRNLEQRPALPLGGRIRLDAWSGAVTLSHAPALALQSPQDKLAFTITPYEPWLTRPETAAALSETCIPPKDALRTSVFGFVADRASLACPE